MLIMAGEIAAVCERMGKLSLGFSGYQYGIHGLNSKVISWARVKEKCSKSKEKLKTKLQHEIFSKTDHRCVLNLAGMEVELKLENCRKKRDVSVAVHTVCMEEMSNVKRRDLTWQLGYQNTVIFRLVSE